LEERIMKKVLLFLAVLTLAGAALALPPSTDQYLVSVGRLQGSCPGGICALFRTDVWILNPSTQSTNVTITFYYRPEIYQPPVSATVAVAAGQTRELADIFQNPAAFNLDGVAGALRFESAVPVLVTGRLYDVNVVTNKGTGTAGAFYPGLSGQLAIGVGETSDIIGVAEEANVWRSNLALMETSGNAVTLTIERLDPNGNVAGSITGYQLAARTPVQLNSVLTQLGVTTASNQRLRLRPTAGSGRILAGVYRIDSRTGDPFSIEFSTAAAAAAHTTGRFEGVVRTADGTFVDGGIELDIATAGLSSFDGLAGLPCGADSFTVDFSATVNPPAAIGGDGTFSVSTSPINYSDGTSTIFTITWTLTGVLDTQGVLSGTLRSATTGGAGTWSSCNGTIDRTWRAGWTGAN
jgi:hypothetical protein